MYLTLKRQVINNDITSTKMLITMTITTIKKAVFQILESKPIWLNSIQDDKTLLLIAVSNGTSSQVEIDISNTEDLVHYYKQFQLAQIKFYSR